MKKIKTFLFLTILFTALPERSAAQKATGFDIEAGLNSSDLEHKISYYAGAKYSYWFNRYIAYSIGGSVLYSNLENTFDSPSNNRVVYYIDDKIINLNCVTGIKISTSTIKNIGLMTDFNFQFEPIPFNSVSLDKKTFENNSLVPAEKSKNKWVFTHFNPSYNIQVSLFYNLKNERRVTQLALGWGLGNYNAYNTYYRATVDELKLRNYLKLKPDKANFSVFLRISGISL